MPDKKKVYDTELGTTVIIENKSKKDLEKKKEEDAKSLEKKKVFIPHSHDETNKKHTELKEFRNLNYVGFEFYLVQFAGFLLSKPVAK